MNSACSDRDQFTAPENPSAKGTFCGVCLAARGTCFWGLACGVGLGVKGVPDGACLCLVVWVLGCGLGWGVKAWG